jgi:hypothetical protein
VKVFALEQNQSIYHGGHRRLHGQIFAPGKICIDLQGWRKCRKIAWSNRGRHIPVGHVGKEREHDCMDAGGRQKTAPAFSAFAASLQS